MQIGRLNRRITVQQPGSTQDAVGQPVATWADFATLWADIKTAGGLETIKAGADTSVVKASIRVRWRTDLTAAMRCLADDGTVYEIKAVLPDVAGRRHVDLVCEVVA